MTDTLQAILQAAMVVLAVVGAVWTVRRDGEAREARIITRIDMLVDRVSALEADVRSGAAELRSSIGASYTRIEALDRDQQRLREGVQSQGGRIGVVEQGHAILLDRASRPH